MRTAPLARRLELLSQGGVIPYCALDWTSCRWTFHLARPYTLLVRHCPAGGSGDGEFGVGELDEHGGQDSRSADRARPCSTSRRLGLYSVTRGAVPIRSNLGST